MPAGGYFLRDEVVAAIDRLQAASTTSQAVGDQLALIGLERELYDPVIRAIVSQHGRGDDWDLEDIETACLCVAAGMLVGIELGRGGAADDLPEVA